MEKLAIQTSSEVTSENCTLHTDLFSSRKFEFHVAESKHSNISSVIEVFRIFKSARKHGILTGGNGTEWKKGILCVSYQNIKVRQCLIFERLNNEGYDIVTLVL